MRKFKIINLMFFIFVFSINSYSLDVFADTINGVSKYIPTIETCNSTDSNTSSNSNNTTVLDGEIGEWDPYIKDKPNFNGNEVEMNGEHPSQNNYYTISVTVPIDMGFYVLPNDIFFSPTYNIKNNGSKTISVCIDSFNMVDEKNNSDTAKLYVEPIECKNNKAEIELKMCEVDTTSTPNKIGKKIDLARLSSLPKEDKILYVLSANEKKGFKFDSEYWESPKIETGKEKAMSNFRAGFVFSIVRQPEDNLKDCLD